MHPVGAVIEIAFTAMLLADKSIRQVSESAHKAVLKKNIV